MTSKRLFRWRPLGGLGEVGMNCMVFHFGDTAVPVDAGILFADANDFGIEAVHSDYRQLLLEHRPRHWLITHAHEDHIGAVGAILDICHQENIEPPEILAPPLAAALIRERLGDDARYPDARLHKDCVRDVPTDARIQDGDLEIRFLETRHSTLDTCSVAFQWGRGDDALRIVHTADFKLDANEYEDGVRDVRSVYGVFDRAPDLLFIDSTNSEREGHSIAEKDVLPGLDRLISAATGRVFVTLFSSNVQRIAGLVALGAKHGRYSCLAGRSMQTAHRISMDLGAYGTRAPDMPLGHLQDAASLARQPPAKQLIICSGSQGESRSVLSKLAQGTHADFDLGPDDTVIFSSKLIPGNEKSVSRLINGLLRQGARILWGDEAKQEARGPIHASGHARAGEIAEVMRFLKPHHIIPVHGELRQLMACAAVGEREGSAWGLDRSRIHIVEDGAELRFERGPRDWQLSERILATEIPPKVLRFESFTADSRDPFLRVRKRAAFGGVISACLDAFGRSQIQVQGVFPESIYSGDFKEQLDESMHGWIFSKYKTMAGRAFPAGDPAVEAELADGLARHVRRETGVRPQVLFHLWGE